MNFQQEMQNQQLVAPVGTLAQVDDEEFEKPHRPFDYSLLQTNKRESKQMDKYESANSNC